MSLPPTEPDTDLDAVLAEYLLAEEAGTAPAADQLLTAHPALAQDLTSFFECRQVVPTFRDAALEPAGRTVGDFTILEVLGRGGMGVVYKARQGSLGRIVALKVLRGGDHTPADLTRFRLEAEKLARLAHPRIVQVYAAGEADGNPYFAMEWVAGGTLAARLAGGWLPTPRQAAELLRSLAEALAHVHQRDIFHRDLKPGNVLLDLAGVPKIADFGLAKQLQDDAKLTSTGAIVGTASYMAPEQAAGQSQQVGAAADIYALGAILYELLAGRPPFLGSTLRDTLDQVRQQEPLPVRQLSPGVERDLETICLKCLAKRPEERYASAADLADDLGRYLTGEPIRARPSTLYSQVARALNQPGVLGNFSTFWRTYLAAGVLYFLDQLAVYFALRDGWPEWTVYPLLLGPSLLVLAIFRRHAYPWTWQVSWVSRQLWAIWGGQALAAALLLIGFRLNAPDIQTAAERTYPAMAALIGLAFFAMGAEYWGRYYLFGLGWMLLAVGMAVTPPLAPLAAAFASLGCLCWIAVAMRRQARAKSESRLSNL